MEATVISTSTAAGVFNVIRCFAKFSRAVAVETRAKPYATEGLIKLFSDSRVAAETRSATQSTQQTSDITFLARAQCTSS